MTAGLMAVLLLLCLAGAAFFAGMETGILSMNRLRLQHLVRRGVKGAETIRRFLTHSDLMLGTTLVGTNLLQVAATVSAASLGHKLAGATGAAAVGVVLTIVVLVFCEYLPKAWFQASPTRSLRFAGLLRFCSWVLRPVVWAVNAVMHRMMGGGGAKRDERLLVTREELMHLAREGVQSDVLTSVEKELIRGVFSLTRKRCGNLMTPLSEVVSVAADAPAESVVETARAHEFNRYPVYDPAEKTYIGVVHVYDILADDEAMRAVKTARDYLRNPQMAAAYLPVDHLLPRMRVTKQPMFFVTDERCEVRGLITLEDVLREITGED